MNTFKIVAYAGLCLLYLATILFGINYKKLPYSLRVIFFFLLGLSISESISKYLWERSMENIFLLHLFGYAEWFLLSLFYSCFNKGKLKPIFIGMSLLVIAFMLLGSIFFYQLNEYNIIGFFGLKVFIILFSTRELYLYYFGKKKHYYFINLAFLITSVINLVLFSFGNILKSLSADNQKWLWILNGIIFILSQVFIIVDLNKVKRAR